MENVNKYIYIFSKIIKAIFTHTVNMCLRRIYVRTYAGEFRRRAVWLQAAAATAIEAMEAVAKAAIGGQSEFGGRGKSKERAISSCK